MTPEPSPPTAAAAPLVRRLTRAVLWDLRTVLGNGEQLLVTLVIPVALLIGLVWAGTPDLAPLPQESGALGSAVAVAVVSSSFTGLSIALAFDRRSGLLRFLVGTPLGRGGVVASRVGATVVVVLGQVALLLAVALALGADLDPGDALALVAVAACGTATFGALGMLLGGTLRAEGVLAVANVAFLAMVTLGGLAVPADRLPGDLVVAWLPPALLGDAARAAATGTGVDLLACGVLLVWAVAAGAAAGRLLRWR